MSFSAVILAGGDSSRMGTNKAWLPYRHRPLLVHQLQTAQRCRPAEIFISGNKPDEYAPLGYPVLNDNFPGCGPLSGIERALEATREPLLLVLAVDMPLITSQVLRQLALRCDSRCGVVPRVDGHIEPLAAFYSKAAHGMLLECIGHSLYHANRFAERCVDMGLARYYDVPSSYSRYFANWNTPGDVPANGKSRRTVMRTCRR